MVGGLSRLNRGTAKFCYRNHFFKIKSGYIQSSNSVVMEKQEQFYDVPGGDPITYHVMDNDTNFRISTFGLTLEAHRKLYDHIPNIACPDDDVILAGYPKCGTHWVWELITMIRRRSTKVTAMYRGFAMLEAAPEALLQKVPSPRIFNTHVRPNHYPKDVYRKKLKCVLVVRSPKDVVVSFYHHTRGIRVYNYNGKFENYLKMFMRGEVDCGSYPHYLLDFQQFVRDNPDHPVHIVHYEDLKENSYREAVRLRAFLGANVDDDMLRKIVDTCRIDKLRAEKNASLLTTAQQFLGKFKENFSMYRKGEIGDWKNWFTPEQSREFDDWWTRETRDLNLFTIRSHL